MALAVSSVPALLLCGYYGENNLGDDALLTVLLQEIPAPYRLLVTAHDAEALSGLAPDAEAVNRRSLKTVLFALRRVDAVVLGGGSLLQDSTSFSSLVYYLLLIVVARLRGCPVLALGAGARSPRTTREPADGSPALPVVVAPVGGTRRRWIAPFAGLQGCRCCWHPIRSGNSPVSHGPVVSRSS